MNLQDKIITKLTDMDMRMQDMQVDISVTKEDVKIIRGHIESLASSNRTLDTEVTAMSNRDDRQDERLDKIEAVLSTAI